MSEEPPRDENSPGQTTGRKPIRESIVDVVDVVAQIVIVLPLAVLLLLIFPTLLTLLLMVGLQLVLIRSGVELPSANTPSWIRFGLLMAINLPLVFLVTRLEARAQVICRVESAIRRVLLRRPDLSIHNHR